MSQKIELLTKDDLLVFKQELLQDIAVLLTQRPDHPKKYLRSKEVRKRLNISAGTLVNMRIRGVLTGTKIGGCYYYEEAQIESLLRGNAA